MKVLVKFNKNIATPKQVKTFKLFDLGTVITTVDDLLKDSIIEIDDLTLPVLKINNNLIIEYYLINELGKTPNLIYPYYTDDFTKEITINDLILINTTNEENVQADWNEVNILADSYIKNKPIIPTVIQNHSELNLNDGSNPHNTTKEDIGLSNVDNTSDVNKPISIQTQSALNDKLNKITSSGVERAYIINADGSQSTKPTSDFGGGGGSTEQWYIIRPANISCNVLNEWKFSNVAVNNFNYIGSNGAGGTGATPEFPFTAFATMINIPDGYIIGEIWAHLVNKPGGGANSTIEFFIQRGETAGTAQTNILSNALTISNDTLTTTTGSTGCLKRYEKLAINAHSLPSLTFSFLQIAIRETQNIQDFTIGFVIKFVKP